MAGAWCPLVRFGRRTRTRWRSIRAPTASISRSRTSRAAQSCESWCPPTSGSASGVEGRPQSPQDVGQRTVRPEVHVVDPRLLTYEMAVHGGGHDAVARECLEDGSDL